MKKFITPLVIGFGLLLVPTITDAESTNVLKINGEQVTNKEKPYVEYGDLFVPVETIAKKMGEDVSLGHNSVSRQVIIKKKNGTIIKTYSNHSGGFVNGRLVPFQYEEYDGVIYPENTNSSLKNGQVYVPIDFIANSKGMNYPVRQIREKSKVTTYIGEIPTSTKLNLQRNGHTEVKRTVYSTTSTKSKSLGTLKKNETFYIYTKHNGRYKIKYGKKTGYITTGNIKEFKYVKPGKKYKDGWVAPTLKSEWSPYPEDNAKVLRDELGFRNSGTYYSIEGKQKVIQVFKSTDKEEIVMQFYMWDNGKSGNIKQSYRVPVVSKELFKLYFDKDATRVWNYFNKGDIPEKFTANGRNVKASVSNSTGALRLEVGYIKKK